MRSSAVENRSRTGRRAIARACPPAIAAVALGLLDRRAAAVSLVAISTALIVLGLSAPNAAERLDAIIAKLASRAAHLVARAFGGLAWLFGVIPMWLWTRAWRRTPLDNSWVTAGSAWTIPPSSTHRDQLGAPRSAARSGARDALPIERTRGQRVGRAAVALVLMLGGMAVVAERRGLDVPSVFGDEDVTARPASTPGASEKPAPETSADGVDLPSSAIFDAPAERFDEVTFPTIAPRVSDGREVSEFDGLPVDDYAHEDEPWAPEHFGDMTQVPYSPDFFLGIRVSDFVSETVNVAEGRRVSYTPEDPELTVWFFGGSTMFGIGQRDDHTLPSVVAKTAEADGISIRALNFGVTGYVNWQATERFEQALTSGLERPDLVVFYDGVNDWRLGSYRVDMGQREVSRIDRLSTSDEERQRIFEENGSPEEMSPGAERQDLEIALAADQYRRGADVARRLGADVDVPVVHIWQPSPFAKERNPVDAPLWERVDFDPEWMEGSTARYLRIAEESGVDPIDLTRVLDDVDVPIYFDSSHTNELGARIIGEAMYEALKPDLKVALANR